MNYDLLGMECAFTLAAARELLRHPGCRPRRVVVAVPTVETGFSGFPAKVVPGMARTMHRLTMIKQIVTTVTQRSTLLLLFLHNILGTSLFVLVPGLQCHRNRFGSGPQTIGPDRPVCTIFSGSVRR